jgi:putative permease
MTPKLQAVLVRERRLRVVGVLIILICSLVVLLAVDSMLLSFVLAFVVNYLLTPIIDVLERRGVPRRASVLIPFLGTGVLLGFAIYAVVPLISSQASTLGGQWPKYQADLTKLIVSTENEFKDYFRLYNASFSGNINNWIIDKTGELSSALPSALSGSLTVLALTPIFAYFMLQDGRTMSRKLLSLVPNNLFESALNFNHQLNEQMGGFIRARFLEAAIVGIVVWLGLQVSSFPYAMLMGVIAGMTNLIPYIGPVIGAVPAILIALFSPDALMRDSMSWTLVVVISVYFFAQLVDMLFIIPMVVARIVNLHPVTVIVVIIIGSQLMGILGMVISIPVASAIKLIFHSFYRHLMDFRA